MSSEVSRRAKARAKEAHERSQEALKRATFLAKEGYRHAVEAERGAARAHQAVADTLESRAARGADDEAALRARAARHRSDAERHGEEATVDDRRHAELEAEARSGDGRDDRDA
jgi:hypothetical protein